MRRFISRANKKKLIRMEEKKRKEKGKKKGEDGEDEGRIGKKTTIHVTTHFARSSRTYCPFDESYSRRLSGTFYIQYSNQIYKQYFTSHIELLLSGLIFTP